MNDFSTPVDVASFMTDMAPRDIAQYRYRIKYKELRAKASARYRERMKEQDKALGRDHGTYKYWTPEEINYILNSEDTDEQQSEKLGRSVYSIQKKRQRERGKK